MDRAIFVSMVGSILSVKSDQAKRDTQVIIGRQGRLTFDVYYRIKRIEKKKIIIILMIIIIIIIIIIMGPVETQ